MNSLLHQWKFPQGGRKAPRELGKWEQSYQFLILCRASVVAHRKTSEEPGKVAVFEIRG